MQVQEEKAGLAQKLESLRAVVAQLESVDPEWEHREKGECEALNVVGGPWMVWRGCKGVGWG